MRDELLAAMEGGPAPATLFGRRGLAALAEDEEVLLALMDMAGEEAPDEWRRRARPYADLRERLARERRGLTDVLAGLEHAFVKGFELERLYPPGVRRQFEDLDVAVADIEGFWVVATRLKARGHKVRTLALGEFDGRVAAVAKLASEDVEVELHCGGFPIHRGSLIPYRAGLRDLSKPRWVALILLAEVFDRRRLFVRDRFDAAMIGRALSQDDRAWLARQARRHGLEDELALAWPRAPGWRRRAPAAVRALRHRGREPRGRYRSLTLVDANGGGALSVRRGRLVRTPLGLFAPAHALLSA